MAHLRRVNENNVDLNRNFVTVNDRRICSRLEEAFQAYRRFDRFLNPASPPARDFYRLKAAYVILKYGMPPLKQAVVGGQYWFPQGLFYGGQLVHEDAGIVESEQQQGSREYQTFLIEQLAGAERVIAIDVHTRLGKYGCDTLLTEKQYEMLRMMFGERVAPLNPFKGVAFDAWGTVGRMTSRVLPGADVLCVTQEFGTFAGATVLHA